MDVDVGGRPDLEHAPALGHLEDPRLAEADPHLRGLGVLAVGGAVGEGGDLQVFGDTEDLGVVVRGPHPGPVLLVTELQVGVEGEVDDPRKGGSGEEEGEHTGERSE